MEDLCYPIWLLYYRIIPPLIMISGFFAIVWDLFGPLFNIVIRFFELVPLLFNVQLANEIITTSVGLVMIIEKVMGFFNPPLNMDQTQNHILKVQ